MWVLALATLLYIWVLSNPILLALKGVGMAFGGSVPGKAATEISNKIYLAILYLILGSPIVHLLLVVFPLDGHGAEALTMLAMVPLVVIGTAWLSSGDWVIRKFWHLYVVILLGCVGYWSLTSFFPDLQGSEASSTRPIRQYACRTIVIWQKRPRKSNNASARWMSLSAWRKESIDSVRKIERSGKTVRNHLSLPAPQK